MRAPCRHPRVPAQSGISDESLTPELDADAAIVDRLMKMVIEAGSPKAFDQLVLQDREAQGWLLQWRSHLTLASRAFYRMQMRAWNDHLEGKPHVVPDDYEADP